MTLMTFSSATSADTTAHDGHDALFLRALNVTLVECLSLPDAVRLLSVCRALWHDLALANHVLRTNAAASHLGSGCSSDWSSLRPTTAFFDGRGWAFCDALECSSNKWTAILDISAGAFGAKSTSKSTKRSVLNPFAAQHLSIAGFVAHRLQKWCFFSVSLLCRVEEREFWQRTHDTRFLCRPLIVPLLPLLDDGKVHEQRQRRLSDQDALRPALNKMHPGLGDSFLSANNTQTPSSSSRRPGDLLAFHWDAIAVSDDGHHSVSCALCDWRERVIREYTARSPGMLSLGTTQIHHLHQEEDAILRQILGSEGQLPQWLAETRQNHQHQYQQEYQQTLAEWLYCALCRYHRRQCETFYQPLKRLFVQQGFRFVAAVDVDWMENGSKQQHTQPTQLLAGISPSGFLCGLYRMDLTGAR